MAKNFNPFFFKRNTSISRTFSNSKCEIRICAIFHAIEIEGVERNMKLKFGREMDHFIFILNSLKWYNSNEKYFFKDVKYSLTRDT